MKPFKMLAIARSNYGKTVLTNDFIKQLINDKFVKPQRVLIFSKTYKSDPSQVNLVKFLQSKIKKKNYQYAEQNCYEYVDTEVIQTLYNTQKLIKEATQKPPHNYIILLDDMISESILTNKRSPLIPIFSLMRHYSISICILLQNFREVISPQMRNQFTIIAVG